MDTIAKIAAETVARLTPDAGTNTRKSRPFDPQGFDATHPECAKALREAQDFANRFDNRDPEGRWISFLGPSGRGKTHLAKALAAHIGAKPWRWMRVLDYLRRGDFGVIHHLCDMPALVLDDIGAAYETEMSRSKIGEIAERRIGKWTVWTSNYLLGGIAAEIDNRVASRMVRDGCRVVSFKEAPDWSLANYES